MKLEAMSQKHHKHPNKNFNLLFTDADNDDIGGITIASWEQFVRVN